jgi:hypothetical protein
MKTFRRVGGVLMLMTMFFLIGCAEDTKTANMRVKLMTMNSGSSQAVITKDLNLVSEINLDIRRCEMHYAHPDYGWFALPGHIGVYNLLALKDSAILLLVQDTPLPQGTLTQFRWFLGPNNSIKIGGAVYPLKVPSAEESGLKIDLKGETRFDHGIEVRLIFDPYHSVVEKINGDYILTPVIQVNIINQD